MGEDDSYLIIAVFVLLLGLLRFFGSVDLIPISDEIRKMKKMEGS